MYRLIVEGIELVLPEGYKPDFSLNFAQLAKQSGSRVFPFTLPACKENNDFFGFAHQVQSSINRSKKYNATLLSDSIFLASGILVLKQASMKGGYTCELQMPPALVSMDVWNSSLRSLDFGTVTMNTELKVENCYTLKVTDNLKLIYPPYFGSYYRIYVNNTIYAEFNADVSGSIFREEFEDIYSALMADFNHEERVNAGWFMEFMDDTLIIYTPDSTLYTLTFALYKAADPRVGRPAVQTGVEFTRLQYQSPTGFDNFRSNTPDNSMFYLPVIKAPKFYNENKNYCGYLNFGFGAFKRNIPREPLKFTLSPSLWFGKTIVKILEILGYSSTGEFVTDERFRYAYLMTLVAIDKQCEAAPFPFNIWKDSFELSGHLPDFTVKSFLESICEQFGIDIDFDTLSKVATISFVKGKIESVENENIEKFVNLRLGIVEHNDRELIQVAFAGLSDEETEDSYYESVPTNKDKISTEVYRKVEYKFVPPRLNNLSTDEGIALINGSSIIVNSPERWMPYTDKTGVSNLFEQWKNTPANYVSFFEGLIAPTANSMLQSVNVRNNYSLQLKGENGLAKQNEVILRHLEDTYEIKVDLVLHYFQISFFKPWKKYYFGGVNFFVKSIEGKSGEVLKVTFCKS